MTGILGGWDLFGGIPQAVYVCDKTDSSVVNINVCNRGNAVTLISMAISNSETTPLNAEWVEFESRLIGKGSLERTGIVLNPGQYLIVKSSQPNVNAVAWGITAGVTVVTPAIIQNQGSAPGWITPTTSITTGSWDTITFVAEAASTYSLVSGSLPTGALLETDTGKLYGFTKPVSTTTSTFTLRAISPAGFTADRSFTVSINTSAIPIPDTGSAPVPGAPTIGTATIASATSVNVSFTAPSSNGGLAIISYTATSSPGGVTGTVSGPGSGTITVSGLTTGTAYTFTVRATNSAGSGPESLPSNQVTPAILIPTPQLWYKNEDIAAYGNGSSITSLTNRGSFGTNYNLNGGSGSTGWSAPSRQTADGFAAVYFDGNSRFLRFASNSNIQFFPTSQYKQWTIFVVYKDGNGSGNFGFFGRYGADGTNGSIGMWPNGEGNFNQVHTNDGFPVNFAMSNDSNIIQRGLRWGTPGSNDGNIRHWTGNSGVSDTSWSAYGSDLQIGGIGSARTSSNNGYLYEILLYEDSLSDSNITAVRAYLNSKFGV